MVGAGAGRWARLPFVAIAATSLLAIAGCGESDRTGSAAVSEELPTASGSLRLAVGDPLGTVDPLYAQSRAERLASRQVHEPLVSNQSGPFGGTRTRPGLARTLQPSVGGTVWTATLRAGVRFQNGEILDAAAVLANVDRWLATAPGRELLPELVARDAPRSELVRFFLDRSSPRFARRLADARLGLVAPAVIASAGAEPIALSALRTGSGPFELRERDGDRTLFARNASWWGTPLGLGPGVDQLELFYLSDGRLRVDGLLGNSFEIADELDQDLARAVEANPLLTVVRGKGDVLGMERSVRGIETAAADQPLADVWLTDIG